MKPPIKNMKLSMHPKGDVTQWFAENPALYARLGLAGHNGIDLVRPHGEPMYAIEPAEVVNVKNDPNGFGKHVRLIGIRKNANGTFNEWTYGHCSDIHVQVGDMVAEGESIADMGNTGFVVSGATPFWRTNPYAGTHLHLGLREVIKTRKGWSYEGSNVKIDVLNYANGYKGAIDPFPYLAGLSEEETATRAQYLTIVSLARTLIKLLLK